MSRGKVIIIQGGQYGSEGKGQIAAVVAEREKVQFAVRTGSINAGHTVYYNGKKFSMQILPTAWVVPGVQLILGPGCYIEPSILKKECDFVSAALGYDIRTRLMIDKRCVWFGDEERQRAVEANRHHAMGATGKGASEAIITKMKDRGNVEMASSRLFMNVTECYVFGDTVMRLDHALECGCDVLLEGTQGALLDFNTGPYPYVTSRMTNAAAWLAEAGLPPVNVDVILVVRSHPIRVAGNSGPMPGETTWPELADRVNRQCRMNHIPEIVPTGALERFKKVLRDVVLAQFPEVIKDLGDLKAFEPNSWTNEERVRHRVCLSEANAMALVLLGSEDVEALAFFEKTTVTKKLRRIANFDTESVLEAIRMNRPTRIAYTFLNYDYPELWHETSALSIGIQAKSRLDALTEELGVPIQYVSTGPLNEHVVDLTKQ